MCLLVLGDGWVAARSACLGEFVSLAITQEGGIVCDKVLFFLCLKKNFSTRILIVYNIPWPVVQSMK